MNHHPTTKSTSDGRPSAHCRVLDAIVTTGHTDGTGTTARWRPDILGRQASGDGNATAAALAGLGDGDPLVLDALPTTGGTEDRIPQSQAPHAPAWGGINPPSQTEAVDASRHAHDPAVVGDVVRHCHATPPASDTLRAPSTLDTGDLSAAGDRATGCAPATASHEGGLR